MLMPARAAVLLPMTSRHFPEPAPTIVDPVAAAAGAVVETVTASSVAAATTRARTVPEMRRTGAPGRRCHEAELSMGNPSDTVTCAT
jgi:hypothetical protein